MTRGALLALAIALSAAPASAASLETFIEAPTPYGALKGTMLAPAGAAPVVLIIPGSGPTDRDGNSPLGVKASPYRLLAEGIAARGVASVRFDKRGMFASASAGLDPNNVSIAGYVADVVAWISAIKRATQARCVWLLGHSEGGLIATVTAGNTAHDTDICGVLLVSAPGRRMGDILRGQFQANPANAPLLDQALSSIAALEKGRHVDTAALHPALQPLFARPVQAYLMDAFSYDPAAALRLCRKPVLILQGTNDLQISVDDAERLKHAQSTAELVVLDGVNHVLKAVPPHDHTANVAAYSDPGLPIAPGVIDAITSFVERHSP